MGLMVEVHPSLQLCCLGGGCAGFVYSYPLQRRVRDFNLKTTWNNFEPPMPPVRPYFHQQYRFPLKVSSQHHERSSQRCFAQVGSSCKLVASVNPLSVHHHGD
jgi:hypothetical protein